MKKKKKKGLVASRKLNSSLVASKNESQVQKVSLVLGR